MGYLKNQIVGNITGSGTTIINQGAKLTASGISGGSISDQGTLVLNSSGVSVLSGLTIGDPSAFGSGPPATGTTSAASTAPAATTVAGTAGNDTLAATSAGNEILVGNGGYDTYQFGRGDGVDTIKNGLSTNSGPSGELDLGVDADQIWVKRVGLNLQVDILGTNDKATIFDWYLNPTHQLQDIKTADGNMVDTQLAQLVQAMATYTTANGFNPATATQMPGDPALQAAMAAAWHH